MARHAAPGMIAKGWGRIVNVTTKLDMMNRPHTAPYGASKAALEMATEVWAKEVEGTGLTIDIVNPGAGANTPGMAEEMRAMSREGRAPRLVEPEEMVPPLLYVVSREADNVNGWRFDANLWEGHCHRPKPPAAPAGWPGSRCTRSRDKARRRTASSGYIGGEDRGETPHPSCRSNPTGVALGALCSIGGTQLSCSVRPIEGRG